MPNSGSVSKTKAIQNIGSANNQNAELNAGYMCAGRCNKFENQSNILTTIAFVQSVNDKKQWLW